MAKQKRSNDWGFPRWRGYGGARQAAEVRLCDRLLPYDLQRFLPWQRLRQVAVDGLNRVVVLGAEERHVRQHEQQVDRRRSGFGGEHVLIADPNERLLRER